MHQIHQTHKNYFNINISNVFQGRISFNQFVRLDPSIATAGVYHCKVVNSFDNTSRVSSPRILITHESNRTFTIWCAINTRTHTHKNKSHLSRVNLVPVNAKPKILSFIVPLAGWCKNVQYGQKYVET